jgi:hypothetical protein
MVKENKPATNSRKRVKGTDVKQPLDKETLRKNLREKIREKQLEREKRDVRFKKLDKLDEKLETVKDAEERQKIMKEIELLEKIDDKIENSFTGEHAQYEDNASYGGAMERNDG